MEFLGFLEDNTPAHLGECCSAHLKELCERWLWLAPGYEAPAADACLWRYMNLAKFLALLKTRSLFLARADHLGDSFEGAKGLLSRKPTWDAFYLAFFRRAIATAPGVDASTLSEEKIEAEAQRLLEDLSQGGSRERERTFVSCWHESAHESEALWHRYGGADGQAIAIHTTARRLTLALGDDPDFEIGRVRYLDMAKEFAGPNDFLFCKRVSFEHEREVRVVRRVFPQPVLHALSVPVDLETLVESIVVSPLSAPWFVDVVTEAGRRFDCHAPIRRSTLLDAPFF